MIQKIFSIVHLIVSLPQFNIRLLDDGGEGVVLQDVLLQLLLYEDDLLLEVLDGFLAMLVVITLEDFSKIEF